MIGLNESIKGSIGIGLRVEIEKWCEEYIMDTGEHAKGYIIGDDLRIYPQFKNNIKYNIVFKKTIETKSDLPNYIKFGRIETCIFLKNFFKFANKDQYPEFVNCLYVGGGTRILKDVNMNLGHMFAINQDWQQFRGFDNVNFNFDPQGNQVHIYLSKTSIDMDGFKDLHCSEVYLLDIIDTPLAEEIVKGISKLQKNAKGKLNDSVQKYLDDVFMYLPGIRFVKLSKRKSLEHNPKDGNWYIF